MSDEWTIRKAREEDLPQIKKLADDNSDALGFVLRASLASGIGEDRVMVAVIADKIIGFQEYYHRRRDGQTTLYHKCVAMDHRRRGVGTALVDAVVVESKTMSRKYLLLKCPENLSSNEFHRQYGFRFVGTENGRRRKLNIWRFDL